MSPRKPKLRWPDSVCLIASEEDYKRAIQMIRDKCERKSMNRFSHFHKTVGKRITSNCTADLSLANIRQQTTKVLPSKFHLLLFHCRNAMFKHDWATVARCLTFAINDDRNLSCFLWRTTVNTLLHHPQAGPEVMDDFLTLVLGLRSHTEKKVFMERLLTLPDPKQIQGAGKFKEEGDDEEDDDYSFDSED